MIKRVLTGILVGALWLCVFLFAPAWVLFAALAAAVAVSQIEFYRMFSRGSAKIPCSAVWGVGMGLVWEFFCFCCPSGHPYSCFSTGVLAVLVFAFLCRVLFMKRSERVLEYAAVTLLGFFYLPFLLSFLLCLAQWNCPDSMMISLDRTGVYLTLYLVAIVKFNDVGGFAFGIPFGRHKCFPSVSPKKSWEGCLGGALFSVGFAVGLVALAKNWGLVPEGPLQQLSWADAVAIGLALSLLGMLGDLVESRFKRVADVKDSAALLPAGGILDMFDSLVFAPVFLYYFLLWAV